MDAPPAKDATSDISWREMRNILDDELKRLPERYRATLILCYLECVTRDEAAKRLGVSLTTLHGRLERARDLLRACLTKRGLTLAAVMSATALGESVAQAALEPTFIVSSTKAAMLLAAGQPLTEGVVANHVIVLTREVIKSMFLTNLKLGTAGALCAGLVLTLIGGSFTSLSSAQNAKPRSEYFDRLIIKDIPQKADSDAEFIRRISKELRGTEPTPAEIHFFVASKDAGRRQKLIDLFIQERRAKDEDLKQRVLATKRVELRARVTGYLIKMHFKPGDTVKKDQVLFEIDARPYQAALDAAEARLRLTDTKLDLCGKRFERAKKLLATGSMSREVFDQIVTDRAEAEASQKIAAVAIALARLNVDYTKVTAFTDGRVSAAALAVGNLVVADVTPLAVIDSLDSVPMNQKK
jgi:biotin carboxyl carrier protein